MSTNAIQAYSRSYNKWISADQAVEDYALFIIGLKDRRAEVATEARTTPEESTPLLALLDGQLAASADVARVLWTQWMIVYRQHRAFVKAQAEERKAEGATDGDN